MSERQDCWTNNKGTDIAEQHFNRLSLGVKLNNCVVVLGLRLIKIY